MKLLPIRNQQLKNITGYLSYQFIGKLKEKMIKSQIKYPDIIQCLQFFYILNYFASIETIKIVHVAKSHCQYWETAGLTLSM